MGDFFKDLENNTKGIDEIGNSTLKGKGLAEKYKADLKKLESGEIAKKIAKTAKEMPEQVRVQNLTKEKTKEQNVDRDGIE